MTRAPTATVVLIILSLAPLQSMLEADREWIEDRAYRIAGA